MFFMNSYHKLLNQVRLLYGALYRQRFILNLSDLSFVYSYRFATRYDVSLIRKISDLKKKKHKSWGGRHTFNFNSYSLKTSFLVFEV